MPGGPNQKAVIVPVCVNVSRPTEEWNAFRYEDIKVAEVRGWGLYMKDIRAQVVTRG